ncbi:MAG: TonB-dependent receptor plug domain-containing protein [Gammaproteobacteria bacterium]
MPYALKRRAVRVLCLLPVVFAGAVAVAGELPELPAELAGEVPQVLTPSRLQQAQVDVAASVTVIDRGMIEALGVRDLPELLRLVPGMMVTNESQAGHTFAVNYHGTNLTDIRRLQVLVDGMSMYQSALSRILWSDLTLSIDDIERIEVTRGPNAAAYGSNSFSAIINIITVHPQDVTGNMVRAAGGNRDTIDTGGRLVGHGDAHDWRLSFSTKQDSGFDFGRGGIEVLDDRRVGVMNWRGEYRPGERDRVELLLGLGASEKEKEPDDFGVLDHYEENPVDTTYNRNALVRWSRDVSSDHQLQVQAYSQRTDSRTPFRACLLHPVLLSDELAALAAVDPAYVEDLLGAADPFAYIATLPTSPIDVQALATAALVRYAALAPTQPCGDVEFDVRESRFDIEVQDTRRLSERLRVVAGAGFRRDSGSSASYTGGQVANDVWRLFGHGEYRFVDPLMLNIGAMLEDDGISGTTLSPRAGLNWRFHPQQSLRLVRSRAYRTQDLYEEFAETRITFEHLSPPYNNGDPGSPDEYRRDLFLIQTSPDDLEPEEITSTELGWFGFFPRWRTEIDVRWFRENLDRLISDPINPQDFDADNNSWTELNGAELQAKYSFAPRSWLWATYAYIDNESTDRIEKKFTARHSGSLAVAHRFASGWSGSAAWYVSRHQNVRPLIGGGQTRYHFERLDLRLARDIALGDQTLQLSANAQCRFDDRQHIHDDNSYDDRIYGYLGLKLDF